MDRKYFDEMYKTEPDPWNFESSWYEQRKYSLTIDALPHRHYLSAFEPGCSVGVLSSLLAERCGQLLATDIVPSAVDRARQRCQSLPGVRVEVSAVPEEWPSGPFDLVVLSEFAYYFDRSALHDLLGKVLTSTTSTASVVAVHWRGKTNYPLSGDEAHEIINSFTELERTVHHEESAFVLDAWERIPTSQK